LAFPAARRRWENARMTGLKRAATSAPIERTARICARPPQTVRFPRNVPLSRFRGCHSHQRGDLFAGQGAEFGQIR
jgi:hypothetical protein